ncbi:MAG: response regulator, partial [Kiritimatiellae bacterium]|nr:response regulator [Kiritimatiellia bacterium]
MSKKILIIDDEPDFIDMIQMRLEANGYTIVSAADGIQGVDAAIEESPDLILLDVMMPGWDG